MTAFNGKASEALFRPLTDGDFVVRQAEALVRRYMLLDAIGTADGVRADLADPRSISPELAKEMVRQLVPWVDYWPEDGGDEAWPIPAGVRIEALCYSPALDPLRDSEGRIGGKRVWRMPETAAEFAHQFWIRAGFGPEPREFVERGLADAFRISPVELGNVAMGLRGTGENPLLLTRLLLSRHFGAASSACEALKAPDPSMQKLGFRDRVSAFERLAELERVGMIVREVQRHAHLLLPAVVKLLSDANASSDLHAGGSGSHYSDAVAKALAADPALRRFCEMAAYMADIDEWMLPNPSARAMMAGAVPNSHMQQLLVSDISGQLASSHAARGFMLEILGQCRIILHRWAPAIDHRTGHVIDMPKGVDALCNGDIQPGQRQSPLNGDPLFRFYGLENRNNILASALLADFERPKGTRFEKRGPDDIRHALADIAGSIGRDGNNAIKGVGSVVHGSAHSKLFLPKAGQVGSAARASESLWRSRHKDESFWANFACANATWLDELPLAQADRAMARSALVSISHILVGLRAYDPKYAARAISDLATGVSAISVNPLIVSKIRRLAQYNAKLAQLRAAREKLSARRQAAQNAIKEKTPDILLGEREIPGLGGIMRHAGRKKR